MSYLPKSYRTAADEMIRLYKNLDDIEVTIKRANLEIAEALKILEQVTGKKDKGDADGQN